jgi:hypothetical protein
MMIMVRPSLSRRSANSHRIVACTDTSSDETGSSAISTRGSVASALAMAIRWRWPPENWPGSPSSAAAGSPTRLISSRQRSSIAGRGTSLCTVSNSRSIRRTVSRGLSEEYGSLEDHLDRPALRRAPPGAERHAVQPDRPGLGGQQAGHVPGRGGLAAARFADEPEDLTRVDPEGHPVHGAQQAAARDREADLEVRRLEPWVSHDLAPVRPARPVRPGPPSAARGAGRRCPKIGRKSIG